MGGAELYGSTHITPMGENREDVMTLLYNHVLALARFVDSATLLVDKVWPMEVHIFFMAQI